MASRGSAEEGWASVERAIAAVLEGSASSGRPAAIGISSPGPLDPRTGVVINPPNVPCWRNFPLAERVQRAYGLPVRLDNDANAAALAEAVWGAGTGHASVFYATIGTGIGTGIVFDRRIYHGRTGAAGEGGHTTIDYRGPVCGCGKRGCIEVLASGPAVARRAQAHLAGGGASKMALLAGGKIESVTPEMVAEAWRAGDQQAQAVLEETADLLGIWLGNMVDVLEPDVVILGGGMSEVLAEWFARIGRKMVEWSINQRCGEIPLVRARYGEDAGIAGGAALVAAG